MIWHEIVCNNCNDVGEGRESSKDINKLLKDKSIEKGWYIGMKGYALCPTCRKALKR